VRDHTLWSEQGVCLILCTSKSGNNLTASSDALQPVKPTQALEQMASSLRGMGTPLPQGPLLLLWPHHQLAHPRTVATLDTPASCSGSHHVHCHAVNLMKRPSRRKLRALRLSWKTNTWSISTGCNLESVVAQHNLYGCR